MPAKEGAPDTAGCGVIIGGNECLSRFFYLRSASIKNNQQALPAWPRIFNLNGFCSRGRVAVLFGPSLLI